MAATPAAPRLLSDLKLALASLSANQSELQCSAHDFLWKIQSQNLRRRLQSLHQRSKSSRIETADLLRGASASSSPHFLGSSWLACTCILINTDEPTSAHEQEQLFAAQTLLHRLRRVRLAEAVDVELEASSAEEVVHFVETNAWMELFRCYAPAGPGDLSVWETLLQDPLREEVVKGIWTLMTLGAATSSAFSRSNNRPLMETLLLALTTVAFRLRFTTTPNSQNHQSHNLAGMPSLVQLLQQALQSNSNKSNADLCLLAVATLFDSVLGAPQGSRGKMSCEPSAMHTAAHELRHDVLPAFQNLLASATPEVAAQACARIAPFAALPWECIACCSADEQLWLALFESASQSVEVMVATMTGTDTTHHKKSKTKEVRHGPDVHAERRARGEVACRATAQATQQLWVDHPGILAAAANACLPHCIRNGSSIDFVSSLAKAFQQIICASPIRSVRAMSLEPLYTLHSTVLEDPAKMQDRKDLKDAVVDHFAQCCLLLAGACIYPHNYFSDMAAPSDFDLEVERNDMRDVVRTIAGSGEGGSTSNSSDGHYPTPVSVAVLLQILDACNRAPFSEPVAHTFSSLAKPLNHLSKCSVGREEHKIDPLGQKIFQMTLQFLKEGNEHVCRMFETGRPLEELLPLSRTMSIANASYSPFLAAAICIPEYRNSVPTVLNVILRASLRSMEKIPELLAPSLLNYEAYDIRGSMRGPGGDDHVGCLTLMRLTSETKELTDLTTQSMVQFSSDLGTLYSMWKTAERDRGIYVFHGCGVTPRTRRILLKALSKADGLSSMLQDLFRSTVLSVASVDLDSEHVGEEGYHFLAEAVFDLAAFSVPTLSLLFESLEDVTTKFFQVLVRSCVDGYTRFSSNGDDNAIGQWNRLRAGMFVLIQAAHSNDLSERAAEVIEVCAIAECEACLHHIAKQEDSPSHLFQEPVISCDAVPAGIFVQNAIHALERCASQSIPLQCPEKCLKILARCKPRVMSLVTFQFPEPSHFEDPRLTTTEVWFQAMTLVAEMRFDTTERTSLLVDTTLVATSLLFAPPIKKMKPERVAGKCMSLDGPQGLAIMLFFISLIRCGGVGFISAIDTLRKTVPVDNASVIEADALGYAILTASLFRAFQGALPPWALECVPDLFSGLFDALGKNVQVFGLVLMSAMEVKTSVSFGSVAQGSLLSGPYFGSLQQETKQQFVRDVQELCGENDIAAWRRVKVLVKRVCGGKKKATDFNQKPGFTRWNFTKL